MDAPSRAEFLAWRAARRGGAHPERMDNPVWAWLVHEGISAWAANERFDGPGAMKAGPGWCFERFGRSETTLPDGRVVHIAGEHEDYYDPDFYIYNDVVVVHPDARVEIFGYPQLVFPPTDFHSATLVGDRIWIVGNLGYQGARAFGTTPVYTLSVDDWSIEAIETHGACPGSIRDHEATLEGGRLIVRGGTVVESEGEGELHRDNHDDWSLDLATRAWTRLTRRPWQQWTIHRTDGEPLLLFEMQQAAWNRAHPSLAGGVDYEADLADKGRRFDPETFEALWALPLDGRRREDLESYPVQVALELEGALVRCEMNRAEITLKVAGTLDEAIVARLTEHLRSHLEALQGAPCEAALEAAN